MRNAISNKYRTTSDSEVMSRRGSDVKERVAEVFGSRPSTNGLEAFLDDVVGQLLLPSMQHL
jgi:hypothetical protein